MSIDYSKVTALSDHIGNIVKIEDASGNVLWKQAPSGATITIEGDGGDHASVVIDGVTYNTATAIVVPIGTVVSCVATGYHYDAGVIRVNYETVAYKETTNYDYTVVGDATITLSTPKYNVTSEYQFGFIEIVDINAPDGVNVSITASGVLSGGSSASVLIDGGGYQAPISLGVVLGSVITCSSSWTSHSMYGSYGGQIKLNGTLVADRVNGVNPTLYEYTVNNDVNIDLNGVGSPNGVVQNINITEL